MANFYGVNPRNLKRQYKDYLSDFNNWDQKLHAKDWLLFLDNIGNQLSLDETAFSNSDLCTMLTNKNTKGKKGALVATVKGTKAEAVIKILHAISIKQQRKVKEVTFDMAGNMGLSVIKSFPNATVIDRFHVQKLALDALQEIRIKHRWLALNAKNDTIENARKKSFRYTPKIVTN